MTKWEYVREDCEYLDDLDKLGQERWELVSVSDGIAYFKRPIEAGMDGGIRTSDFDEAVKRVLQKAKIRYGND